MIGPGFAVILGVACLSLSFVITAYVVWVRMVGLEPTLGQQFVESSTTIQSLVVIVLGVVFGVGAEVAPNVETGVVGVIMLGAAAFASLIGFEVYGNNRTTRE